MSFGYQVLGFGANTSGSTLTDGLVSWWSLDETSGTRVDSVTATGNDLTDINTVTSSAGKVSNAGDFNYINNEYLIKTSATLAGSGAQSVAGWLYRRTAGGAGNGRLLMIGTTGGWDLFGQVSNLKLDLLTINASSMGTSTWYFFYASIDPPNLLVEGSLNNLALRTAATTATRLDSIGGSILLGNYANLARAWNGLIDEVGYWNRKLTASEITELYNSGSGIAYPG